MKTKNHLIVATVLLFSFFMFTQQACKKDNIDNPPDNQGTIEIPEEETEQNISAANGGTISFDNGLKLEIPANALSNDTKITVKTYRPFAEITSGKSSNTRLTGAAVSQIVDCGPNGTTFSKPVKLTIPYYPELLPEGYSESDLLFLTYNNDQWDTLDINVDTQHKTAYAYVNHFSLFKIKKEDNTNWRISELKLGNKNNMLTLSFKNDYSDSWIGFLCKKIHTNYDLIQNQEIYYEIKLYRKKTLGKELIADKQFYKGFIYTQESNSTGKEIQKGPEAENKNYFSFDKLPKKASMEDRSDIFVMKDNNNPGQKYAAVDIVTFDKNKNVVSAVFTNLKNNIPQDNDDFLAYSTIDGYNKYFKIVPISELEPGKKYYFKIKIRSYGIINTKKFLSLSGEGEFTTSKFTLDDIGNSLEENNPPSTPVNVFPQNNSYNISLNPTLQWSCSDPDDDQLTYNVFFGTDPYPPLVEEEWDDDMYNPGTLQNNTTYYWKIKANDNEYTSTSAVWSFTTGGGGGGGNNPPNPPVNVSPSDGATNVSTNVTLRWNCTDPDGDYLTYSILFGDNYPPSTYEATDINDNYLEIDDIDPNTTYYWSVEAMDEEEVTEGPVWSFTTGGGGGGGNTPPVASFTVSPSSGSTSTTFSFDASGSYDNEDPASDLQVRWDFDGDGSWDSYWDYDKTTTHQYDNEGTYTVKLLVKDTEGLTAEDAKTVTVNNGGGGGTGTFTDPRDGQEYAYVEIGSQTWMAENLNYQTADSWWYDNSSANGEIYGRLYTWQAAQNACPAGWHLPSDDEWKQLEMFLGMSQIEADKIGWRGLDEGGKMKESGTNNWEYPNLGATNSSGFTGLPGGYRIDDGTFHEIFYRAAWWTSSESSNSLGLGRDLRNDKKQVYRERYLKVDGRSVRCLKD